MKILLDTHILIWHLTDDVRLSKHNSDLIENPENQKFISLVSLWEIAIKTNIGKLKLAQPIESLVPIGIDLLDLKLPHVQRYATLPLHHRDPFDRMLIAQAQAENLTLMTDDPNFPLYDIPLTI